MGSQEAFTENNNTLIQCYSLRYENEVALTLIELGVNVHQCNADGLHVLHICTRIGSVNIVSQLLDLGVDPNTQESNGATPLLLFIVPRQQDVTKILLEKDASVDLADVQDNTPLHVAAEANDVEVIFPFSL